MLKQEVRFEVAGTPLAGSLEIPLKPIGLVIFAHGSGSSRHSPRNQAVAASLQQAGLGTFLFDLLTDAEESDEARGKSLRFNIGVLAERLVGATRWVQDQTDVEDVPIGYFGASTGAAAALTAAAELGTTIGAVVSRGGRPDLAAEHLDAVTAPVLLIIGGEDHPVLPLNEDAYTRLHCEKALRIIPGASHLFAEPGALEKVAGMSAEWFSNHLAPMVERHA
jgi:putative phosphoribosyl transferase